MKVELCPYCDSEVTHLPPDGLSYCGECERIVEGQTRFVSNEIRDAMLKVGLDVLDTSSMSDVFELAWRAGRLYEAEKTLKEMKVQIQAG